MASDVERIKEKINIVDLVSSYIKLEKAGVNYRARCPFHHEKTPSFYVSPERGYYCFGCSAKGDIFSFVQQFEGLDFRGALKILADRAGVKLEFRRDDGKDEKTKLFDLMEESTKLYENALAQKSEALAYLKNRGLALQTVKNWRIGYAPNDWHWLESRMKKFGTSSEMEMAGLVKKGDKGLYDKFRGRIMFPMFDASGRVIAFSGRAFDEVDNAAKYLNSPETPIFYKSAVLYGLYQGKAKIREQDYIILVEGQMDLLMSHQAGFSNTVATSGTSLTEHHLTIIKRFTNRIKVAYDSDGAGWKASKRAWELALKMGMEIKIAEMPAGSDPADLILKDPQVYADCLKKARHIIDLSIDKILESEKDARLIAKSVKLEVLPYISHLESSMEKSYFVKQVAERCKIDEEAIWQDLERVELEPVEEKIEEKVAVKVDPKNILLDKLLGIYYWQQQRETVVIDLKKIRAELERVLSLTKLTEYESTIAVRQAELIFEAEVNYDRSEVLDREIKELLVKLEVEGLTIDATRLMGEIHELEKQGKTEEAQIKLLEVQGVFQKINRLKNSK